MPWSSAATAAEKGAAASSLPFRERRGQLVDPPLCRRQRFGRRGEADRRRPRRRRALAALRPRARAAPRRSRTGNAASPRRSGRARPRCARAGQARPPAKRETRAGRKRSRAVASRCHAGRWPIARAQARVAPPVRLRVPRARPAPRRPRRPRVRALLLRRLRAVASSVTWRRRSRSARRDSSLSGSRPSVSSASARSSASLLSAAAAPCASSSWRRLAAPSSRQARRSSERRAVCFSPANASSRSSWYGGAGQPALLELAGHRDQPLTGWREVVAGGAAAPRVRAGAPVSEDPPREHEAVLARGPQLGECHQLLVVEESRRRFQLGLHVGLCAVLPDEGLIRRGSRVGGRSPARGWSCPRPSRP